MPTIVTHAAVPIATALALGSARINPKLLVFGVLASVLPDFDVVAFRLNIAYADDLGHRGASHSLFIAVVLGLMATALASRLECTRRKAFAFVTFCAASHGLLDMLTNGGLGVAIWWPWSNERYFFPCQIIEVSPLSLRRIFSPTGLAVVKSEFVWVWIPAMTTAALTRVLFCRLPRST